MDDDYMPLPHLRFGDDQQIVFADEHENALYYVKDFKDLIEAHVQLPVTDLKSMTMRSDPESLRALYGNLQPDRIWIVLATIETPDGEATSEVFIMYKDGKLSLPHGVFLHLETFGAAHRRKATEQATPFTRDYINTLEECVSDAWRLWRDLCYYAYQHRDDQVGQALRENFTGKMDGLYKKFQDVGFLDQKEERHNPFPTGFMWSFGQKGEE